MSLGLARVRRSGGEGQVRWQVEARCRVEGNES